MSGHTYLVTGALGCIGSWVLKHLVERGDSVVASDVGSERVRPGLLMSDETLAKMSWRNLDVIDTKAVTKLVAS